MQVAFASLCREACARLHEEAGLAGDGAHRLGIVLLVRRL